MKRKPLLLLSVGHVVLAFALASFLVLDAYVSGILSQHGESATTPRFELLPTLAWAALILGVSLVGAVGACFNSSAQSSKYRPLLWLLISFSLYFAIFLYRDSPFSVSVIG